MYPLFADVLEGAMKGAVKGSIIGGVVGVGFWLFSLLTKSKKTCPSCGKPLPASAAPGSVCPQCGQPSA